MEIFKVNLRIRDCMDKEWMIANGKGSYAMQTVSGTNTRSYHGLLVASQNEPLDRNVILSNILEDVYINGEEFKLYTVMNEDYISPGYKNLYSFKYDFCPEFIYKLNAKNDEIFITKKLQMVRGKNAVVLKYTIEAKSDEIYMDFLPLLNYRNFHGVNSNLDLSQMKLEKDKVKFNITNTNNYFNEKKPRSVELYMKVFDSEYISLNHKYKDISYFREKERGFEYKEDNLMPGKFNIKVDPNTTKTIYIYASLEDEDLQIKDIEKVFSDEEKRKKELIKKANLKLKETKYIKENKESKRFLDDLVLAADYFVVDRGDKKSIIAGYPWFADWGRDILISMEGLLLKTKRYDDAKMVLDKLSEDLRWGLIPNSYDEFTKEPLYNSADAALLYINALKTFLNYTNDEKYIKEKLDIAREIVKLYEIGTDYDDNNIYEDEDGLLNTGREYTQNTWMDAKVDKIAVTPRNGKAVEMNALWYNALIILAEFEEKYGKKSESKRLREKANKTRNNFLLKFKSKYKGKGLKDLIDDDVVRPNQLFSMWTHYEIVDPKSDLAKEIIDIVDRRLRNRFGLKSLEKGPKYYIDEYSGNAFKRDMSYHQGVSWVWLLELYYEAVRKRAEATKNKEDIEKYEEFLDDTIKTYMQNLYQKPCVMTINEINDSTFPYDGKGAVSQAWSVSAIIKIVSK